MLDNEMCSKSTTGQLCGACRAGFHGKQGTQCLLCDASWVRAGLNAALVIVIVFVIYVLQKQLYAKAMVQSQTESIALSIKTYGKIVVSTYQIISKLSAVLSIEYPSMFQEWFLANLGWLSFDVLNQGSIACLAPTLSTLRSKFIFAMAVPWLVLVTSMLLVRLLACTARSSGPDDTDWNPRGNVRSASYSSSRFEMELVLQTSNDNTTDSFDPAVAPEPEQEPEPYQVPPNSVPNRLRITPKSFFTIKETKELDVPERRPRERTFLEALLSHLIPLLFVVYPSVVNTIFQMLSCRSLSADGSESVNRYDYTINCGDRDYLPYKFCAVMGAVLYGLGIPLFFSLVLWRRREQLKSGEPAGLQFLVRGYKPQYYWVEIVEYMRKFVLTGVLTVIATPGSPFQTFVGLVVSFFFFALSIKLDPYAKPWVNVVKGCAEVQVFGTLLVTLMLKIPGQQAVHGDAWAVTLVLMNTLLMTVPVAVMIIKRHWGPKVILLCTRSGSSKTFGGDGPDGALLHQASIQFSHQV